MLVTLGKTMQQCLKRSVPIVLGANNFSTSQLLRGTMEHLSFTPSKKSLVLKKSPIPTPKDNEVLIKVAYAGVCGTDVHIVNGSFPCKPDGSITLGHEFCGTVECVGKDVKEFKAGDPVSVDPHSGCNGCHDCHSGQYHLCPTGGINSSIGIWQDGGWSTHVVVPANQTYHVPEGVTLKQAALTEPLSCLAHGWNIASPVYVGDRVLVVGAGIIGLFWTCALHLHGLRGTVTVVEANEARRKMVDKLDLGYKVKSPEELKCDEFDLVVDCSGNGRAIEAAFDKLGRGGRLVIFGCANPKDRISVSPYQMYKNEITISAVNINKFGYPKAVALTQAMGDCYLDYDSLNIKMFQLSEHQKALEALKKGEISKAMFVPGGSGRRC